VILIDSKWQKNRSNGFDFGILIWRDNEEIPQFLSLQPNEKISWTFLGPKRCIGSRSSTGDMVRCPENTIVRKGKRRCGPCSAVDIYDPCIRCIGKSCNANQERAEKCAQTDYVVYLALFSDRSLKVGVSVQHRLLTRWVEQGADYGMVLAKVRGGMKARNIENTLATNTMLKKSVHSSRKAKSISTELSDVEADDCLSKFKESIMKSPFNFDFEFSELTNLTKYYNLQQIQAEPIQWRDSKSKIDGKQLFGDVAGMKGTFLVTQIEHAYTVTNLRQLVGYSIDSEQEISTITQSGLLDYF
jgi:hypothetical protein